MQSSTRDKYRFGFDILPLAIPAVGIAIGLGVVFYLNAPKPKDQKVEVIPPEVQSPPTPLITPIPRPEMGLNSTPTPSKTGIEIIPPSIQGNVPLTQTTPPTGQSDGGTHGKGVGGIVVQPSPLSTPVPTNQNPVDLPSGMSIRSEKDTTYSFHTVVGVVPVGTEVNVDGRAAVIKECPSGSGGEWGSITSPVSYAPGDDPHYYSNSPTGAREGWIDLCGVKFESIKRMW